MSFTAFNALVRRDLRLFFLDKRAMTMSFLAPILIGSFFGYLFGGVPKDRTPSKISVAAIDQDGSAVSKRVVASMSADSSLDVKASGLDEARASVRAGKTTIGAVIPAGFGERAARAFFRGQDRPEIELMYDPSHATELAMVRGILTQHVMEAVSAEATSAPSVEQSLRDLESATGMAGANRKALIDMLQSVRKWNEQSQGTPAAAGRGFNMPYTVKEEAITARQGVQYNGMAHSFAGMSVQFILFMGIDAGLIVLPSEGVGCGSGFRPRRFHASS